MDCYFRKRRARTDRLQGHRAARVEKATRVLLGAAGLSGALDIVLNHVNDDTLRLVCCVSQRWRQAVQDDPTHRERARSVAAAVAAMRSRAGPYCIRCLNLLTADEHERAAVQCHGCALDRDEWLASDAAPTMPERFFGVPALRQWGREHAAFSISIALAAAAGNSEALRVTLEIERRMAAAREHGAFLIC